MKNLKRRYCWIALALVPFLGCLSMPEISSLKSLEQSVVFQPQRYPVGIWNPQDLAFEDARIKTEDGLKLHGWYCEASAPRAVVLFAHANAGNVTGSYWKLRFFTQRLGVSVLCFDYRGYGKSEGTPSEEGLLKDARAARHWLSIRTGVAERDIVLWGQSLGGAVVIDLAANDGARALVLESTFTSIPDVADSRRPKLGGAVQTRFDSLSKIGKYHGPLLQIHGDADRVIPFELGEKLFKAANPPKQFVRVHGADHMTPPSLEVYQAMDGLLKNLPAASTKL